MRVIHYLICINCRLNDLCVFFWAFFWEKLVNFVQLNKISLGETCLCIFLFFFKKKVL
jgi:hypothetical protein